MPTLYLLVPDTPEKLLVKKLDYAPNGDYSLPLDYDGFLLYDIEGVKWKIKEEGYLLFLNFHTDYTSPISIYCVLTDYPYNWLFFGMSEYSGAVMSDIKFNCNLIGDNNDTGDLYYTRDFYTGWDDGVSHGNQYVMANRYSDTILSPLGCLINMHGEYLAFEAFGTQFKYLVFERSHVIVDTLYEYRDPIYLDRPLTLLE
jgi:hypothetical protein